MLEFTLGLQWWWFKPRCRAHGKPARGIGACGAIAKAVWYDCACSGFAPEPHVHIEAHVTGDDTGVSIPMLYLKGTGVGGGTPCLPEPGLWYDATGHVDVATGACVPVDVATGACVPCS